MAHIALIGGGNLGSALAHGWKERHALTITTASGNARDYSLQPLTSTDIPELGPDAIIVLAVKQPQMRAVLERLAPIIHDGQRVVSLAAGLTIDQLQPLLPKSVLMRAMPTLGAAQKRSVTGLLNCDADVAVLFQELGEIIAVRDDRGIDAITALIGCGPGYMAWIAQVWLDAAAPFLKTDDELSRLYGMMVANAGTLIQESGNLGDLIGRVGKEGSTTHAIVASLAASGTAENIKAAMTAALERAQKISAEF